MRPLSVLTSLSIVAVSFAVPFKQANVSAVTDDKTLVSTYTPRVKTLFKFSINQYINSFDELTSAYGSSKRPANVILFIDKDGNLTDEAGNSLDKRYLTSCNSYTADKLIPCFYLKDAETEQAFATVWKESWKKWDISVISDKPEILLQARKDLPNARGIIDYSKSDKSEKDFPEMIQEVHSSRANTLLISKKLATLNTFRYFQARFKTVWVDDREASDLEVLNHITLGADGIFVKNVEAAIGNLSVLNDSIYEKGNYNRSIFNIAHRGMPKTNYENSLEGCIEAYEKGASHIEIDIQVTSDNKLAIMHDDTMARTTNVEDVLGHDARISDFTEEELKQFVIDSTLSVKLKGDGVAIPMLDEIFDYFKGKEMVIVVEIKNNNSKCVEILKDYIEKADIASQIVVISFYQNQLTTMRDKLPNIPTADLNNYDFASFSNNALRTLNTNNFIGDLNYGCYSDQLMKTMNDRGYAAFFWTADTISSLYSYINGGIIGCTNNVAGDAGVVPISLNLPEDLMLEEGQSIKNFKVTGKAHTICKTDTEKDVECSPLSYVEHDDYYDVIFQGKFSTGSSTPKLILTLFSDITRVNKFKAAPIESSSEPTVESSEESIETSSEVTPIISSIEEEQPTSSKGCGGSIGAGLFISSLATLALLTLLKGKKEN